MRRFCKVLFFSTSLREYTDFKIKRAKSSRTPPELPPPISPHPTNYKEMNNCMQSKQYRNYSITNRCFPDR